VPGFQAAAARLVSREARLGGRRCGDGGAKFAGGICAISAICALSPLLICWVAGPLPIGAVLFRRPGDKRDNLLPTRCMLADVPYVIRRPCPLAGDSLGVVFLGLSKLLNQEDALGAPCLDTVIPALRRRALAGRRNAADRRNPSLRYHITACYTDIRLASADAFAVVGGGCTGGAHGCKAEQGRRGKDGADVWFLLSH
jgi:hypothetical protein